MPPKLPLAGVLHFLLSISLVTGLGACAASGTGELFRPQPAPADRLVVYHYRVEAFRGSAWSYDVVANGALMVRIGNGGYFRQELEPGTVEYRSKLSQDKGPLYLGLEDLVVNATVDFEPAYTLEIDQPGVVFLRWTPVLYNSAPKVERVSEAKALSEISGLRAFEVVVEGQAPTP